MSDPVLPDDVMTCPWRSSLRRSRKRRTQALRRRLLRRRTRNLTVALSTAMLLGAGGALAATTTASPSGQPTVSVSAVQRALKIPADGVQGPVTQRALRAFQASHGLLVDGVLGPQTERAMGLASAHAARSAVPPRSSDASPAVRSHDSGPLSARLAQIARCESGGDPRAVSSDGRYRGRYQFDRATWRAVGGSGDPAKASAAEQDRRAAALLAAQGTSAWPVCAR